MSIALIVTRGYGNGTLAGSISAVVLRGYSAAAKAWTEVSGASASYSEESAAADPGHSEESGLTDSWSEEGGIGPW